jgi:hypothetical protein
MAALEKRGKCAARAWMLFTFFTMRSSGSSTMDPTCALTINPILALTAVAEHAQQLSSMEPTWYQYLRWHCLM